MSCRAALITANATQRVTWPISALKGVHHGIALQATWQESLPSPHAYYLRPAMHRRIAACHSPKFQHPESRHARQWLHQPGYRHQQPRPNSRYFGNQRSVSTPCLFGTLPGGSTSRAAAINDRGQIVGSSSTPSSFGHAFLFENGAMVDLGTLPGGNFSEALGINSRGQVVGSSTAANTLTHAALWTPTK